jgi:hypothetical protein
MSIRAFVPPVGFLPARHRGFARGAGLAVAVLLAVGIRAEWQPPPMPLEMDTYLLAPVRVHLLSASNAPAIATTLSSNDVTRILGKVNRIWAQAGIVFWIESVVREPAASEAEVAPRLGQPDDLPLLLKLRPPATRATNLFHLYYVKEFSANGVYLGEAMFVKDTASLRKVPGGIDEPIPRVTAHELGHALSLGHHTNELHVMARRTTGTRLDGAEIRQARAAAARLPWIERATTVWQRSRVLRAVGEEDRAREMERRLECLPAPARPF